MDWRQKCGQLCCGFGTLLAGLSSRRKNLKKIFARSPKSVNQLASLRVSTESDAMSESSFKRKNTSKQWSLPQGTRVSPSSLTTTITSTGIPSLDDILGGGLPLSCSLLILAPDSHSAYGELVQKYFVAQGIACGQRVCLIGDGAIRFVHESMWTSSGSNQASVKTSVAEDEEDVKANQHDDKIKIAWRYEHMKQFRTTVPYNSYVSSLDAFRAGECQ